MVLPYEEPVMDVIDLELPDVITTSNPTGGIELPGQTPDFS